MNLMSSMAKTLVGSVIAIVSVAPDAAERDDLVLLRGLGGNQLDDGRVDLELREVDRGNAVLLAEERGDLLVLDEAELDQVVAELPPVGLLMVQGLLELVRSDALLFEKQFADANGHVESTIMTLIVN